MMEAATEGAVHIGGRGSNDRREGQFILEIVGAATGGNRSKFILADSGSSDRRDTSYRRCQEQKPETLAP